MLLKLKVMKKQGQKTLYFRICNMRGEMMMQK